MTYDIKEVVRSNVLALLQRKGELRSDETGVSRLMKLGFALGSAQRILGGTTSLGLDLVQEIATAFDLKPWQLLVPELDPEQLPGLTADPTAWPFPMVNRKNYYALGEPERIFVQGSLEQAIKDRPPKRQLGVKLSARIYLFPVRPVPTR